MIVVTGGSGLVGAHILLQLIGNSSSAVKAIYRNDESFQKAKTIFGYYGRAADFNKIEWVKADILDIFSLDDAFKNTSTIIHAAGLVSFDSKDKEQLKKINIEGTANVANAALTAGVKKLVFISSVAALGESKEGEPIVETDNWEKTEKTSTYSISKHYAENEIWRASAEGLSVAILNPSTIIGPGDWSQGSPALFRRVSEGLNYYTNGQNGFVAVEDVAALAIKLMDNSVHNERFIANGANLTFKELFESIAKSIKAKPPKKAAKKWLGNLVLFFDQLRARMSNQKAVLTKDSLEAAYSHKKFDNSKSKEVLHHTYKSITEAIEQTGSIFCRHF
jgi:nucleoside-diphosphate-sugar epimerase